MLLRQLHAQGPLSPEIKERVRNAASGQLDEWSVRFVDARDLSHMFDTASRH